MTSEEPNQKLTIPTEAAAELLAYAECEEAKRESLLPSIKAATATATATWMCSPDTAGMAAMSTGFSTASAVRQSARHEAAHDRSPRHRQG